MAVNLSGSLVITGSITTTGTISMSGSIASASYANNATSASYALNATTGAYANTSTSASYALNATTGAYANTSTSASYALNSTSASFATNTLTASYVLTAQTASFVANAQSASNAVSAATASFVALAQSASNAVSAATASFVALAQSASNAVSAQTASFANTFTVNSTLTAQTLVVQTITSSVDFVTGSTRFGSIIGNTHVFTGSMAISGGFVVSSTTPELTVSATGVTLGNVITDTHNITGSVGMSGSLTVNKIAINSGNLTLANFPSLDLIVSGGIGFSSGGSGAAALVNKDGSGNITFYGGSGDIKFTDVTMTSNYLTIKNAGNVGIGITDPSVTFNVGHSSHGVGIAYRGSSALPSVAGLFTSDGTAGGQTAYGSLLIKSRTDYGGYYSIGFYTAASDNTPVERMRIQSNGNIGIGVTPSVWDTLTPLQIKNVAFAGYTSGTTHVLYAASNFYYGGGDKYITNGAASLNSQAGGEHVWYNAPVNSSGAGAAITFVERMRITSGGNVGIGTGVSGAVYPLVVKVATNRNWAISASGTGYASFRAGDDGYNNFNRGEIDALPLLLNSQCGGNVGIGTTSANYRLDVNGDINIPGTNKIVFNNEPTAWYIHARTTTSTANLGSALKNMIYNGGGSNEGIAFTGVNTGAASMEIRNDGRVWVKENLNVGGTITESSSIRYKTNIETVKYGLDKVLQLRGVTYDKKDTGIRELGLIAEEVNVILPDVVIKNEEGEPDSVSYGRLTAVLIEAVKDLQAQINELKAK